MKLTTTDGFDFTAESLQHPFFVHPIKITLEVKILFLDEKTSDFKVACGKRTFPCHKIIFAMRSDKLAKMSSKKEVVKILWYSEKTVETFLKFLYTDLIDDDDATTNLLRMAYRFDVGRLFNATSDKLCSSLCKENVLEILVAAAETNNVELMRQVTAFLQDNRDLLKKPDVIEQVVKNLDKKNAKKLLDLVKGKF